MSTTTPRRPAAQRFADWLAQVALCAPLGVGAVCLTEATQAPGTLPPSVAGLAFGVIFFTFLAWSLLLLPAVLANPWFKQEPTFREFVRGLISFPAWIAAHIFLAAWSLGGLAIIVLVIRAVLRPW